MKRALFLSLVFSLILILSACQGTLSVALDTTATPEVSQSATLAVLELRLKTLEPRSQELNLNSDSETIRLAMLNSHHAWQSLWFDGQVTWYSAAGDAPQVAHNQVWVERLTGQFRSIVGPQDGDPLTLQISDGTNLVSMDLATGNSQASTLPPGANIPDWDAPQGVTDMIAAHPLAGSMEASVRDMIFPNALAQRGGTYTPVTVEKVAGQTALVVDWGEGGARQDRFWVDARTGVVLRWQSFDKAQNEQLVSDMLTRTIVYNPVLRPSLFNLNVSEKPRFALDPSGEAGVAKVVPTTPYKPGAGELYFVIDRSPEALQLVRLPGNCVTGGDPCPRPEPVDGFPNQNNTIEPLIWSPDGSLAVLVQQGVLFRYDPAKKDWRALAHFPILLSGVEWSPDGKQLAFVVQEEDNKQDLYTISADGANLTNLTNGKFWGEMTFLWPDGWLEDGRVLFSVIHQTTRDLYSILPGKGEASPFFDLSQQHGLYALSPNRQTLAFSENTANGVSLQAGKPGEEARRLATFQQSSLQQMLWSPDGSWLAFAITSGSAENHVTTVYTLRADGTDLRQQYQNENIQHVVMLGGGTHLLVEGTSTGRLTIINVESGESRTLEAPGLRLDQRQLGASWR